MSVLYGNAVGGIWERPNTYLFSSSVAQTPGCAGHHHAESDGVNTGPATKTLEPPEPTKICFLVRNLRQSAGVFGVVVKSAKGFFPSIFVSVSANGVDARV